MPGFGSRSGFLIFYKGRRVKVSLKKGSHSTYLRVSFLIWRFLIECFLNLSRFHWEMQTTKKFKLPPTDLRKGFLSLLFISLECNCKVEDSILTGMIHLHFVLHQVIYQYSVYTQYHSEAQKTFGVELTAHPSGRKDWSHTQQSHGVNLVYLQHLNFTELVFLVLTNSA